MLFPFHLLLIQILYLFPISPQCPGQYNPVFRVPKR
jgi:hypothetical protein